MKTNAIFVALVVLGGFCEIRAQDKTPAPQTANSTNALRASAEFKALDADRRKLAELFFADADKKAKENAMFFVDPVKFALLGADEVVADLKEKNAAAKESNLTNAKLLAKIVAELNEHGFNPDAETSSDPKKLNSWLRTPPQKDMALPPDIREGIHKSLYRIHLRPENETVETVLATKRVGSRTVGGLNYSTYYNRGHLIAGAFDKQRAYNFAYADTAGAEEPYRKFYAKRFSELIEEGGGQTGTQIFIDVRTKISSEWRQQNSK